MKQKVVIAGGSGFLGVSLAHFLIQKDYDVVILTRGPSKQRNGIKYVQWDAKSLGTWKEEINGSNALVNMTGKSVNCIYTKKNREEIINSRIESVSVLQEAIKQCNIPPQAFVQAGSLAIFGDTTEVCDESSSIGEGFSVEVCKKWEETFFQSELPKTRQVLLRIGFALGRDGGALEPLIKLAKVGLGGTIGSGEQYISWLHIDDLNEMFLRSIENKATQGIYNATGQNPTTNKEFMKTLRKVLNKGWSPPAPTPFVKLGAYLIMRADPGLALTGRNCIPKKLENEGFVFKYSHLETALKELV